MIGMYKLSGNGANQGTHDDSNNENEEGDDNWGRFNAERVLQVVERQNLTNDEDDPASSLQHLPMDYLLTWHIIDKHNIICLLAPNYPRPTVQAPMQLQYLHHVIKKPDSIKTITNNLHTARVI